jgi:hypothetical protein
MKSYLYFVLCVLNYKGGGIHGLALRHKVQGNGFCPDSTGRNYSRSLYRNKTSSKGNCAWWNDKVMVLDLHIPHVETTDFSFNFQGVTPGFL